MKHKKAIIFSPYGLIRPKQYIFVHLSATVRSSDEDDTQSKIRSVSSCLGIVVGFRKSGQGRFESRLRGPREIAVERERGRTTRPYIADIYQSAVHKTSRDR